MPNTPRLLSLRTLLRVASCLLFGPWFGPFRGDRADDELPVVEYPADETDEG
jgi:hypothetical protein